MFNCTRFPLDNQGMIGYDVCVDVIFRDSRLDRLETDAGFDAGLPSEIVRAYRRRMQQIRAAADERDFYSQKSLRFEKLHGDRKHQRSMRLNDQWRLILEIRADCARRSVVVVAIEDYH